MKYGLIQSGKSLRSGYHSIVVVVTSMKMKCYKIFGIFAAGNVIWKTNKDGSSSFTTNGHDYPNTHNQMNNHLYEVWVQKNDEAYISLHALFSASYVRHLKTIAWKTPSLNNNHWQLYELHKSL